MTDDKKKKNSGISISVGGNVSGSVNASERDMYIDNSTNKKEIKVQGDYIEGDKNIHGDVVHGDKIVEGTTINNFFQAIREEAKTLEIDAGDKGDLDENITKLEQEISQEKPSEKRVDRYLRTLEEIAPTVVDMFAAGLVTGPVGVLVVGAKAIVDKRNELSGTANS